MYSNTRRTVSSRIIAALKGTEIVGAYDAIGHEQTVKACAQVVSQLGGGKVVSTLPPPEEGLPDNVRAVGRGLLSKVICRKYRKVSIDKRLESRRPRSLLIWVLMKDKSGGELWKAMRDDLPKRFQGP
jgi:hypothetical protein